MLFDLLNNVVSDVNGLALTLNSKSLTAVARKGFKSQPLTDPIPGIQVYQNEKAKVDYVAFGKTSIDYQIAITLYNSNNRDWLSSLSNYVTLWESLIRLYALPNLTSTNLWLTNVNSGKVWEVRVEPGPFLEPEDMVQMFDIFSVILHIRTTFQ